MPVQQIIEWDNIKRFMRQAWIAHIVIPQTVVDGRKCIPRRMKALLTVLEAHARDKHSCNLKRKTIATAMGSGLRTADRAVKDCEALELITVTASFWSPEASKYVINWTKVAQIMMANPETAKHVPLTTVITSEEEKEQTSTDEDEATCEEATEATSEEADITASEEDSTYATMAGVGMDSPTPRCQSPTPRCQSPTPRCQVTYATVSRNDQERTISSRVQGEAIHQASLGNMFQTPAEKRSGNLKCEEEGQDETEEENEEPLSEERPRGPRWPYNPTATSFHFDFVIQALWEHALSLPWQIAPEQRLQFFTLCRYMARTASSTRRRGKPIRNFAGLFTWLARGKRWRGTHDDEEWAHAAIRKVDGKRSATPGYDPYLIPK